METMIRKRIINPEEEIEHIVTFIKKYFIANGNANTKAVIGISGGKDSTIAAALLVRALGPERVIPVMMPNGTQKDIDDSYAICNALKIPVENFYEIDISASVNGLINEIGQSAEIAEVETNLPARIRMATLYTVAAIKKGRVVNTGNASELYVGYTTKYGDLAGDVALFKEYYVRDVVDIGRAMPEVPRHLVEKAPGDGMSGKTDEDNLGFSYDVLDTYILDHYAPDYDVLRELQERHRRNIHKRCIDLPHPNPVSRHWNDEE